MLELKKLIEDYLKEAKLMQLATAIDNQPWVCNVWFAANDELNIYWFSSTTRRHSHEVLENQKVAAAIAMPQAPNDAPRGLQLSGIAEMLIRQEDIDKAIAVYEGKIFSREKIKELMSHKERPHAFYRIKPSRFVLFDAVNFSENPRQEFTL